MKGRCATSAACAWVGPVAAAAFDEVVEEFAFVGVAARLFDVDPLHAVATRTNARTPVSAHT